MSEGDHDHRLPPLVATKLDPPSKVQGLVSRPDLIGRLIASKQKLTLVAAPAGWGKSTLVAEWSNSAAEPRPFAFVRLGPEDDDPSVFWAYVVRSIGLSIAGTGDIANDAIMGTPGIDPTTSLVPDLINRLHGLDASVVLVLDDYHTVDDPEIHRSLTYLVDNAPRGLQVVVVTRSDPPLPLPSYRAEGTMSEIRTEQLRMSTGETHRFLQQRFGVDLPVDEAAQIGDRTEGWAAGIQLAGLALANEPDRSGFIASFSGDDRNVADYLASEVLHRQPERLRRFLLGTSVLDDFNAEVCDHLLGTDDSAAVLADVERSNLFLVRLSAQRAWYRYHHLLRDWLRHEHRLAVGVDEIAVLHRRAAAWMRSNDHPERAIGHLVNAGDVDEAAKLMSEVAMAQPGGELVSIHRWIGDVPDRLRRFHPALALSMVAPAFAGGDYEAAIGWIDVAEGAIGNAEREHQPMLSVGVGLWRGIVAFLTGDLEEAVKRCRAILNTTPPGTDTNAVYAEGFLGAALFATSGPEVALPYLENSAASRRRLSITDVGITAQLAAAHAELGNWEQAETAAAEALSLPVRPGRQFPYNAAAHYASAQVHHHRGDIDRAISDAEQGIDLSRDWLEPAYLGWGLFVMANVIADAGQERKLLVEAKRLIATSRGQQRLLNRIEAAERRLTHPRPRSTPAGMVLDALTPRELDMLRLMRGDLSIREIGAELYISHNTAKGYTKTIYQKLGVNSREDAVATALAAGLI